MRGYDSLEKKKGANPDAAEAEDALPGMDDVLNGSFTFSQDEDSIFIGNLQYSKVS